MVGRQSPFDFKRSMRNPTPKRPTITQSSLTTSQGFGEMTGLTLIASPDAVIAKNPRPISNADAAGSRPDTKRGNQ